MSTDETIDIVGVGVAPSRGVKAGMIVNIELATQSIAEAAKEAELMSGLVVERAYVNVTGKHLHGENSRGVVAITNRERIVGENDVLRVIEGAQNIRIPSGQQIIHVLSREFRVDDQGGVKDPIGMTGVRLEAEVHIVTAGITALSNLNKAVNGAGIRVIDGVMSSLAAADAVVAEGEKDLGVAVVDVGGGISDVLVYLDGGVYASTVVPVGGIHVTQDLSIGLKIPIDRAEAIKKRYGAARVGIVDPTEKVEIEGIQGRPPRRVLRQEIAEIIEPRMKEIYELIDERLIQTGKKSLISGGVILTGGGNLIEGTLPLAEEVFQLPVTSGYPSSLTGFTERVSGSDFATAIGLLRYASKNAVSTDVSGTVSGVGKGFFSRMKHWISENL